MLSDPVDTKNTVVEVLLWNTDYQQLKEDFYKLGREFNPIFPISHRFFVNYFYNLEEKVKHNYLFDIGITLS